MEIKLQPRSLSLKLGYVLSLLFVSHCLVMVAKYLFGYESLKGLVPMFDMGAEQNIPTLFSSMLFVLAALLLACIAVAHKREGDAYFQWALLVVVFGFLAIDEAASIHEMVGYLVFYSNIPVFIDPAWVVPYGLVMIVGGIIYYPFLKNLPERFRKLFMLAGGVFVLGALGFEIIFGKLYKLYHADHVSIVIFATVEELLEFGGLIIFIFALLSYLHVQFSSPRFVVTE